MKDTTQTNKFTCWECDKEHPTTEKRAWGFDQVCSECEDYLFDEAEKRNKREFMSRG